MLILLFKNVLEISNFEKSAKTSKKTKKPLKNSGKNTSNFFCVVTSTGGDKISLIKKACLMLNFLNLKLKPRHLFFG